MTMALGHATSGVRSLTREEAEARGALLAVDRYDIAVDMRGLFEGEVLESTSTITFRCLQPGASTFVDCVAEVRQATLNGQEIDLGTVEDGRIPLTGLAADNVLVVSAAQSDTGSGAGILRTVDPSDKLVYVWTSFEADDARRAWACFDQPDLKAPHGFTVKAHETWTVTSNGAPTSVEDQADGGRLWTFPDTPPLSTYVVVVNAGPFHEMRQERDGSQPGPLLPPVPQAVPRAGRPGALRRHRGRPRLLRRALRAAVPPGALRPGVRPEHGRGDGELGLRHLDRQRAVAQPPHLRPARVRRLGAAARDGAHVVRRPGHHAVVGRPVAQRGVRLVGLDLGGRERHRVHRRLGDLPGRAEAHRLPGRHGPRLAPDPRRRPRRDPGDGQLRRHHLRQGPERAQAAGRLRRRGRLRRGPARLLPRPRVGQHPARRPDVRGRGGLRTRPDGVDRGVVRPRGHRHPGAHRRPRSWRTAPTARSPGPTTWRSGSTAARTAPPASSRSAPPTSRRPGHAPRSTGSPRTRTSTCSTSRT